MLKADTADLPVVDISAFARAANERARITSAVRQALEETGFLYVRGLGLAPERVAAAFAAARGFFSRPAPDKAAYSYTDIAANFGYQGIEVERLDPGNAPDLKESFTMRNALAENVLAGRWPDESFRRAALGLYEGSLGAAYRLLEVLAAGLSLPAQFFVQRHRGENVTLRFLHYPANLPVRSETQLGAGAHTDYGSITLLFQDEVGGLEVRGVDGRWRYAPPIEDYAIINTGDLMEHWTNGRFRSTLNRVRPVSGARDRYSIALFVDPDAAVDVECIRSCVTRERPARYPRVTAGEHIRRKIAATHETAP
jgi:isopenicillin N synthase-like dioxygenase